MMMEDTWQIATEFILSPLKAGKVFCPAPAFIVELFEVASLPSDGVKQNCTIKPASVEKAMRGWVRFHVILVCSAFL